MTGNIALDVVIGLVFIYLLYSLYATIIMEIISSSFGLRARNLRFAIRRMLKDEKKYNNWFQNFGSSLLTSIFQISGKAFNLKKPVLFDKFFEQPSIKYLSNGGMNTKPSYISAESFSKGIIEAIRVNDPELSMVASVQEGLLRFQLSDETKRRIELILIEADHDLKKFGLALNQWYMDTNGRVLSPETLKHILKLAADSQNDSEKFKTALLKWYSEIESFTLGEETRNQLQSLLDEANNDVVKFRILLERWFNETMERSIGWFKRSTQIIVLVIGSVLVVTFNIDSIAIIKKLSTDKEAREKLANVATEFSKENGSLMKTVDELSKNGDSTAIALEKRLDSLDILRGYLDENIAVSQNIIASNWNLPDTIIYSLSPITNVPKDSFVLEKKMNKDTTFYLVASKSLIPHLLMKSLADKPKNGAFKVKTFWYKMYYIFSDGRLWGYLLSILALSMGAPFWFDLLNKLVKLRTSKTIPTESGVGTSATGNNSKNVLLNRAG